MGRHEKIKPLESYTNTAGANALDSNKEVSCVVNFELKN